MMSVRSWLIAAGIAALPVGPCLADQGKAGGKPGHATGLERAREAGQGKKKGLARAEQNQERREVRKQTAHLSPEEREAIEWERHKERAAARELAKEQQRRDREETKRLRAVRR